MKRYICIFLFLLTVLGVKAQSNNFSANQLFKAMECRMMKATAYVVQKNGQLQSTTNPPVVRFTLFMEEKALDILLRIGFACWGMIPMSGTAMAIRLLWICRQVCANSQKPKETRSSMRFIIISMQMVSPYVCFPLIQACISPKAK